MSDTIISIMAKAIETETQATRGIIRTNTLIISIPLFERLSNHMRWDYLPMTLTLKNVNEFPFMGHSLIVAASFKNNEIKAVKI